jgi:hypothetical protein
LLNDNLYLNVILHFSGHYSHVRRLGSFIAVQHRLHDPVQVPVDRQEKLQKRDSQVSQLVSRPGGFDHRYLLLIPIETIDEAVVRHPEGVFGQILLRGVLGVVRKSRGGPGVHLFCLSCFIAFLCGNFLEFSPLPLPPPLWASMIGAVWYQSILFQLLILHFESINAKRINWYHVFENRDSHVFW